jgi:hypothetical protein
VDLGNKSDHYDAIPKTAQFVYRVHCIWCGKGWLDGAEVLPEDLFNIAAVADSDDDFEQVDGTDYGDTDGRRGGGSVRVLIIIHKL